MAEGPSCSQQSSRVKAVPQAYAALEINQTQLISLDVLSLLNSPSPSFFHFIYFFVRFHHFRDSTEVQDDNTGNHSAAGVQNELRANQSGGEETKEWRLSTGVDSRGVLLRRHARHRQPGRNRPPSA